MDSINWTSIYLFLVIQEIPQKDAINTINWTDIVATIVVVYSAVLSTYNAIRDKLKEKPHGKVKFDYKWYFTPNDTYESFTITFYNTGVTNINIVGCGIILPNKYNVAIINVYLPKKVSSNDSFDIPIDNKQQLLEELRKNKYTGKEKLRCYCRDALGNEYRSKKFKISLD